MGRRAERTSECSSVCGPPSLEGPAAAARCMHALPPAGCSSGSCVSAWETGCCGPRQRFMHAVRRRVPQDSPALHFSVSLHSCCITCMSTHSTVSVVRGLSRPFDRCFLGRCFPIGEHTAPRARCTPSDQCAEVDLWWRQQTPCNTLVWCFIHCFGPILSVEANNIGLRCSGG